MTRIADWLGWQQQVTVGDLKKFTEVARPRSVKVLGDALNLDTAKMYRDLGVDVTLRWAMDGDWDLNTQGDWLRRFHDHALAAFAPFRAAGFYKVELGNEPVIHTVDLARVLNDEMIYLADTFHAEGYQVIGPNFSTGHPQVFLPDGRIDPTGGMWQYIFPGLAKMDIIGDHEYAHPSMQTYFPAGTVGGKPFGPLCFRYRAVRSILPASLLHIPWLITECGVANGGGFENNESLDAYMGDLGWYARGLAEDAAFMLGAQMFIFGGDRQWPTFDLANSDERRAAFQALLVSDMGSTPPPNPPPNGGHMTEINLKGTSLEGAKAFTNAPVAGQPYFHLQVADSNYQFDGIPNADSFWKNGALPVGNAQVCGQRADGRGEIHPSNGDGFVSIQLTSGSNYDPATQDPPMHIFVALNPRKDDTTAMLTYDAKLSDEIWVGNIVQHTHWSLAFNEQAAPVPPDDNPEYTGMTVEEAARERAWSYVGVAYNKSTALIRFGAAATPYPNAAGAPQTPELKFRLDGVQHICQGFAGFITLVKSGDWGNVRRADWFG